MAADWLSHSLLFMRTDTADCCSVSFAYRGVQVIAVVRLLNHLYNSRVLEAVQVIKKTSRRSSYNEA